jgi:hypothetical protein
MVTRTVKKVTTARAIVPHPVRLSVKVAPLSTGVIDGIGKA